MNSTSLKSYLLSGGIWTFIGKVFTVLSGFFISVVLARLLSTNDMAIFFISNSLAIFLALIGRFGLDNTLLQLISVELALDNMAKAKGIILSGITLVGFISIALAFFLYFGVGNWIFSLIFQDKQIDNFLGFIVIWLVILSFQLLLGEIFRALKDINMAVIFGGSLTAFLSVAILIILYFSKISINLYSVLMIILLCGTLNLILGMSVLYSKTKKMLAIEKQKVKFIELLQQSWPFCMHAVMHYILVVSGLWIIGSFGTEFETAQFGAAIRLTMVVGMPMVIVNSVIPPLIAGLNARNEHEELEKIIRGVATLAAIPTVLIITFLFLYSTEVMSFVFGESYGAGADVFQILLIAHAFAMICGSSSYLLMMTGYQKVMMYITITSATVSVVLGLFFVLNFGAIGVAWASTISILIQQIMTLILAYIKTGVWSHISLNNARLFILDIK